MNTNYGGNVDICFEITQSIPFKMSALSVALSVRWVGRQAWPYSGVLKGFTHQTDWLEPLGCTPHWSCLLSIRQEEWPGLFLARGGALTIRKHATELSIY